MSRAILALLVLVGVARADDGLDPDARRMLDPVRVNALRPVELIARLALARNAVVADVGAGPGFLTLPLARAVPRGRVIATDVSGTQLAIAARRAADEHLTNVETRVVRADDPGLPIVDLAVLCQVDQYLPDRVNYLKRLDASLAKHGRVAIVNFVRFRDEDLAAARAASFVVVDEWSPSKPFFLLVLARSRDSERR